MECSVSVSETGTNSGARAKKPLRTFTCTYDGCFAVFTKKRKFVIHQSKHTEERLYACEVTGCTKTYTNSSHLKRHIKVSHENQVERVRCNIEECGKEFYDAYGLRRHYSRAHDPNRKYAFPCLLCNQGFHREQHLIKHNISHTGQMPFVCSVCNEKFATKSKCKRHQRTHTIYRCQCGEAFERFVHLQRHAKLCPLTAPNCYICNKQFSTKANLRVHQQIHVEDTSKHVFRCPQTDCDNFYFYKKNLVQHIKSKHKTLNFEDYINIKRKRRSPSKSEAANDIGLQIKTGLDETIVIKKEEIDTSEEQYCQSDITMNYCQSDTTNDNNTSDDMLQTADLIKVEYLDETSSDVSQMLDIANINGDTEANQIIDKDEKTFEFRHTITETQNIQDECVQIKKECPNEEQFEESIL